MAGERRPSPDTQVRAAMHAAKLAGRDPEEAWTLATNGHVCDSYRSARGDRSRVEGVQLGLNVEPPGLRPSPGSKRCAGCTHVRGAGHGLASCALYGVAIYPGVLWPHRTQERREWQAAILGDPDEPDAPIPPPEWMAAYCDEPTLTGNILSVLLSALDDPDDDAGDVERGEIAA